PQLGFLEGDQGVLPRAPDAVGRLLVLQVNVHRLLVGPADEVVALVDRELHVDLLAADDDQPGLGAFRQLAGGRGRRRRGRGGCRGGGWCRGGLGDRGRRGWRRWDR